MKKFISGRLSAPLSSLMILALFVSLLLNSCRKESSFENNFKGSSAMLIPETGDEPQYSLSNPQEVLDDITFDGNMLSFNSRDHFVIASLVLDSLGDSTVDAWQQGMGFTSLYKSFMNTLDLMPDDPEETERTDFFNNNSNTIHYAAASDEWDINAATGGIARLLNVQHKAKIGGNIFYSDYNADVMVGPGEENLIAEYATQNDRDDQSAYVQRQHVALKTTGEIRVKIGETRNLGAISCGSPQEKKSRCEIYLHKIFGSSTGKVKIWHEKRKWWGFGFWSAESRGSQVSCNVGASWFWQQKVWGNQAKYHEYHVSYATGLASWSDLLITNLQICVAPMCGGVTLCQSW